MTDQIPYRQPRAVLIAACLLSAAGGLLFNVMPVFLGSAAARFALDDAQIGWVGSAYLGGFAPIAATSFLWINRFNWRKLTLAGGAISVLSLAASALASGFVPLIAALICAGLGLGTLYTVGIAIVAENDNPDSAFGVKLAGETFLGVAMLFALPLVFVGSRGFIGVALAMAAVTGLLGLIALRSTPTRREAAMAAQSPGHPARFERSALVGLAALFISFGVMTALWAFLERIASDFGLTSQQATMVIAVCLVTNGLAAIAAAMLGDRLGRVLPLIAGMVCAIAGIAFLNWQHDLWGYAAGVFLTMGLSNLALSYQMGLIASSDGSGRSAVLIPAALAGGGAIGPALAGSLLGGAGYGPLYALAATTTALSLIAFAWFARTISREEPT